MLDFKITTYETVYLIKFYQEIHYLEVFATYITFEEHTFLPKAGNLMEV